MNIFQAKQWMEKNRIGPKFEEWELRHPDWRKVTDVVRTFDLIAPDWRGEIQEAA